MLQRFLRTKTAYLESWCSKYAEFKILGSSVIIECIILEKELQNVVKLLLHHS